MRIDETALKELITESQDLQSDAVRGAKAGLPELRELRHERGPLLPDPAKIEQYNLGRRSLLKRLGLGAGAVAGTAALGGSFGAAMAAIIAKPVAADTALDIQMLQTASSLERLAVNTYAAALTLPFIADGNAVVKAFAETTMSQHDEHRLAFIAQTEALGGVGQDAPNPQFQMVVDQALPTLMAPLDVVGLAAALEEVASDTYLEDLTMFEDVRSKEVMGSVMGVEVQHLAILKAVEALLQGGGEALIAIPTDLAALPDAAGSVGFPDGAFLTTSPETIAPPASGAVQ